MRCISALMSFRFCFAHRHMLSRGAMNVLPNSVNEYSTPRPFDPVRFLAINPVDSRLRSVRVSMRCETPLSRRRSCPCRWGLSCRANRMLTVHRPTKMGEAEFNLSLISISHVPLRTRNRLYPCRIVLHHFSFRTPPGPTLPVRAQRAQGTPMCPYFPPVPALAPVPIRNDLWLARANPACCELSGDWLQTPRRRLDQS
jgi:hypothetical protein